MARRDDVRAGRPPSTVCTLVVVDLDQCESDVFCTGVVPGVFEVRDDDFFYVLDEHPPEELRDGPMEGARSCPKSASSMGD